MTVSAAIFATTAGTAAADDGTATTTNPGPGDQTSQPFLAWGDPASYELAPNGDFSQGLTGWTVSGDAGLVSGEPPADPTGATSATAGQSLELPAGSSATSPPTSIEADDPSIRFFVVNHGDPDSPLSVSVTLTTPLGLPLTVPIAQITGADTWAPSPAVWIAVNLLAGAGTVPVQFTFTPIGGSDWQIDDLYVDPRGRT